MALFQAVFTPRFVAKASSHRLSLCLFIFLTALQTAHSQKPSIFIEDKDLSLLVGETKIFQLTQVGVPDATHTLTAIVQHPDILQVYPTSFDVPGDTPSTVYELHAHGNSPGHSEVTFNVTPAGGIDVDAAFLSVGIMHSNTIYIISYVIGWIYFLAWTVSFYPQIYENYRRTSVVGLNFDFVTLNIMGFTMYSLFNCGLYFSETIQAQYFERFPRSHNPIQLNDVFFSVHAAFATLVTIIQCIFYEREEQRVSNVARGLVGVFVLVVIVTGSLAVAGTLQWLDFLYACSYIKLAITFIKYVPQAYMNYKRKSTQGWSIGNIFLDFTGGSLSILQMMMNAYNYDDWASFFGDFTKFGLGLFSLAFDIFFLMQHYWFYRPGNDFMMVNSSDEESDGSRSGDKEYVYLDHGRPRYIPLPGTVTEEDNNEDRPTEEENSTPYQAPPA